MEHEGYYATHSLMSDPGRHASLVAALPDDVGAIAEALQGLCIYDVVAEPFYGFRVPSERAGEIHLRGVADMLERIVSLDARPLSKARPVEKRLVSRCHHYGLLLVSMLRSKGIPARLRGGFAAYFNAPFFEDHWVAEYWKADEDRWVLADAQLDAVWLARLPGIEKPLDLSSDQFVLAADAWQQCRSGAADATRFGIGFANLRGLWFITGSLVRDLAALEKMEMLPWDVWGVQAGIDAELTPSELAFYDRLAAMMADPDRRFTELRESYDADGGLRVPPLVFNALTDRSEPILPDGAGTHRQAVGGQGQAGTMQADAII
ncbi:hypothetical protein MesoLjLc_21540 [Mesorhizobium sp. L-8-10]|uniref:transglutaminase-like domain-containing protein n=1 Tax=Mesorhizobium sp. L-8-10 TaxID=2744523 RepID=UPI0019371B66|nr:transglutaminase-like domain-containing protein [Mesorhizobium sp. L-8-10]BCH30224.1 hypothetical protein MesoLjLc_21540 [Mesorhizobium sp. L-8-10]